MAASFQATSKRFECEICGSTDGKCSKARQGKDLWMCYHFSDARDTPVTPPAGGMHYKHIGLSSDGLWAKWLLVEAKDRPRYLGDTRNRRKAEPKALPPSPVASALPVQARHQYYSALLDGLDIAEAELEDLVGRGIDLGDAWVWGFRSIEDGQPWPDAEPPAGLPGASHAGAAPSLYSQAGCLCPVKDHLGQLQGFQVRMREGGQGGRYRWLSSPAEDSHQGASPHLPNGELPLSVCYPVASADAYAANDFAPGGLVGLTEGTGAKPFLAAQRLQVPVVGAAGGNWAGSPESLKAALAYLQPSAVVLYCDAGSSRNKDILRRYWDTANLIKTWGYAVRFAWWGQHVKGAPEIDEIGSELLAVVHAQAMLPKDYWGMVKRYTLGRIQESCLGLGVSEARIPSDYNRRLNPGPTRPADLPLGDLVNLANDLADRLDRYLLISCLNRKLARSGNKWESLYPWLRSKRFELTPGRPINLAELEASRWPKTKELAELSLALPQTLQAIQQEQAQDDLPDAPGQESAITAVVA